MSNNELIALLDDAHDCLNDKRRRESYHQRAKLLDAIEAMIDKLGACKQCQCATKGRLGRCLCMCHAQT